MLYKINLPVNRFYQWGGDVNNIIPVVFTAMMICWSTLFSRLRSLHDQLKEMGVEIDDKELAMTLLPSLPEDYKPLITVLE